MTTTPCHNPKCRKPCRGAYCSNKCRYQHDPVYREAQLEYSRNYKARAKAGEVAQKPKEFDYTGKFPPQAVIDANVERIGRRNDARTAVAEHSKDVMGGGKMGTKG
jgi:hypothetical protein